MSLGLSCQTSRQIAGHVPLLRQLTGDDSLEKASLPFDWLISTARGLVGLIDEGTFFPETREAFCADQGRLRLRAHDVLYWHESRLFAGGSDPSSSEDSKAKFQYTSGRFDRISKMDRVVAVMSDTQPNLPWKEEKWKIRLTDTSVEEADEARGALGKFLGRPVELLMVSRNPRQDLSPRADFNYYHMIPEKDGWAGNGRNWAAVFTDYFGRR